MAAKGNRVEQSAQTQIVTATLSMTDVGRGPSTSSNNVGDAAQPHTYDKKKPGDAYEPGNFMSAGLLCHLPGLADLQGVLYRTGLVAGLAVTVDFADLR